MKLNETSKIITHYNFLWSKFSVKSRSLSPPDRRKKRKINDKFPLITQNPNELTIGKSTLDKTTIIYHENEMNDEDLKKINLEKKIKAKYLENDSSLIDENPLFPTIKKLNNKENVKQNQVKIYQLTSLLKEEGLKNEKATKRKALICNKILMTMKETNWDIFQEVMAPLQSEVEKYLFCNDEEIYEKINALFSFYREKNTTYYDILQKLIMNFEVFIKNRDASKKEKDNKIELLEKKLQQTEFAFSNFQNENLSKEDFFKKQIGELNENFNLKISKLEKENMSLKSDKKLLERDKNIEGEANKLKIEELLKKEAVLKEEIAIQKKEFERNLKNEKIKYDALQENFDKFMDNYKNALFSLKFAKDKIKTEQEKNDFLLSENSRLAVRAAAPFQELTPRPSFTELYNLLPEKDQNIIKKTTTVKKTKLLTEKFGLLLEKKRKKKENKEALKMIKTKKTLAPSVFAKTPEAEDVSEISFHSDLSKSKLVGEESKQTRMDV